MNEILHNRHITDTSICTICQQCNESIPHAIFKCIYVKPIWEKSEFANVLQAEDACFSSCATQVVDLCGWEKMKVFLAMAWACWASRKKRVMANADPNMEILVNGFLKLLTDVGKNSSFKIYKTPSARYIVVYLGVVRRELCSNYRN